MASGTIIRILIGLLILIIPGIIVILFGSAYWGLYAFVLFIPFLFVMEDMCKNCDDCWLTGYCEYNKKIKFVKNIFKFLGYDKDKIDNIQIQKYKTSDNKYIEIFKYIKAHV